MSGEGSAGVVDAWCLLACLCVVFRDVCGYLRVSVCQVCGPRFSSLLLLPPGFLVCACVCVYVQVRVVGS